ncbi:small multidrug resistance pump [Palleronia aestuarii]|uniref:Small multidrug resistance pump n=1 Tax=Palleronia aestuarii TaxID=568105 RepID=A0A2W7NK49_9RHOB|nr:multidrug efflux SMR transporter [Palleronia aestuarii]PZX18457.1 small multidrug resistance pump [Palleronia aestuarii]
MVYVYLVLAVLAETVGTSALQLSQQFTRPLPSLVVVLAYAISFYLLSHALASMPVGVVYALWSGLGICFIAVIGFFAFGQVLDTAAIIGLLLIIAGIATLHLFSDTTPH